MYKRDNDLKQLVYSAVNMFMSMRQRRHYWPEKLQYGWICQLVHFYRVTITMTPCVTLTLTLLSDAIDPGLTLFIIPDIKYRQRKYKDQNRVMLKQIVSFLVPLLIRHSSAKTLKAVKYVEKHSLFIKHVEMIKYLVWHHLTCATLNMYNLQCV